MQDQELSELHLTYLSIKLLQLFKQHNPTFNKDEWEFVDCLPTAETTTDLLTQIKNPHTCEHLCVFMPELVSG